MKKLMLTLTTIFLTSNLYAADNSKKAAVVYINGTTVTFETALMDRDYLKSLIEPRRSDLDFDLAFNKDGGICKDILQWLGQKLITDRRGSEFWTLIDNPENLQKSNLISEKTYNKYLNHLTSVDYLIPELEQHNKQYQSYMNQGKKVILVPHSQGNFYANASLNLLLAYSKQARDNLYSVGLGSNSGHLPPNASYFNSSLDVMINLSSIFGAILPANISIPFSFYDLTGHSFQKSYLREGNPRESVIKQIFAYADKK